MSWFSKLFTPREESQDRCPLQLDLPGWHRQPRADPSVDVWQWRDGDGDTLTVRLESMPAFAGGDELDLQRLRTICRERARQENASIVQVDPALVASFDGVQVITKARVGMAAAYAGRLTFPLTAPHFVVQIEAVERGTTGQRDAMATAIMAQRGELQFEAPEVPGGPRRIKGWAQDPYDQGFDRDTLNFVSDDERLDVLMPGHPLSKLRRTLAGIQETATLEGDAVFTNRSIPSSETPPPRRGRISSAALGMLCFHAKRFDHSETAFRESIAAWETSGSAPDADIATQFLLLGLACECQGKHRDALPIFQRAERAAVASLGPNDVLAAHAANNQARVLLAMKDPLAAEPLFERALASFESTEGDSSSTAVALNGLGMVRHSQQRAEEAIRLFERALRIFEKEHGAECQDCADVWRNLAMSLAHIGDSQGANHALSRAKAISGDSSR